jgi:acyl-CoA thioester hydrolase
MTQRGALRAEFRHIAEISTRWMDNDIYGHVNNVTYYSYFDTAVNCFLIDQGVLDIQGGDTVGFVVESGCSYFSPIAFPDALQVGVRVTRIGNSSVRYEIGIFRNDDECVCAAGHFVHVYVDRRTGRPVPIPEDSRRALRAIATSDAQT